MSRDLEVLIVMEYASNGSVEQYVKDHPKIPVKQRVKWCDEMAQALAYLHGRKPTFLIHRDVKPR